jgi:hypothetical protein
MCEVALKLAPFADDLDFDANDSSRSEGEQSAEQGGSSRSSGEGGVSSGEGGVDGRQGKGAVSLAQTQAAAVRTVRTALDLITFQRGKTGMLLDDDGDRFRDRTRYYGDNASRFAIHGQGTSPHRLAVRMRHTFLTSYVRPPATRRTPHATCRTPHAAARHMPHATRHTNHIHTTYIPRLSCIHAVWMHTSNV